MSPRSGLLDGVNPRLLISLSGVTPRTVHEANDLLADLDGRDVPVTQLVCPKAAEQSPALIDWVKDRTRRGDAVLMHGYDHTPMPSARSGYLRRTPEFASLPAHEARLRLTGAFKLIERLNLQVDGFAPPRWQASPGTLAALRERGVPICADSAGVHDLRSGELHRARVLSVPPGPQRTETLRCFALVLSAARTARRNGLVRLSVDAAELDRPGPRQAFLDAVGVALEQGAEPATYGSLVTTGAR